MGTKWDKVTPLHEFHDHEPETDAEIKKLFTENPHTVLHGRFLINQCFGLLNEPEFVKRAYYSFCCN